MPVYRGIAYGVNIYQDWPSSVRLSPLCLLKVRPPMPPVYFFVIDVSVSAVNSGMVATTAAAIKSCLESLPGAERTRIGFLTFDQHLHFYSLKASLTQPQMMVRS